MRALMLSCLLFLLPAAATAESLPWSAPVVGTTVGYDMSVDGQTFPADVTVAAVDGDLVTTTISILGSSIEETSFRNVMNVVSAEGGFDFDQDALRSLWPLEAGKSVALTGQASIAGQLVPFSADIAVEAIETLQTPAGSFRTARLTNRLEMQAAGTSVTLDTLQWVDADSGLPVRTELTVASGDTVQSVSMLAIRGPVAP